MTDKQLRNIESKKVKYLSQQYSGQFYKMLLWGGVGSLVYFLMANLMSAHNILALYKFPYIISIFAFIGVCANYNRFLFAMQIGVTRTNFFKAKILFVVKMALLVNVINILLTYMAIEVVIKLHASTSIYIYIETYFGFFHNMFIDVVFMFITDYLVLLFLMMIVNTFGTFVSLFNQVGKSIFYVIFIFVYISWQILLTKKSFFHAVKEIFSNLHISSLLNLLLGITEKGDKIGNPIHLIITMIIFTMIVASLNYLFTKLEQVKR